MTTQQKIEAIRQKCIEANPEIVELKFGCWIGMKPKTALMELDALILDKNYAGNWLVRVNGIPTTISPKQILSVLGRPIRLADVLLAMGKTEKGARFGVAASYGMFTYLDENAGAYNGDEPRWNLAKDDLTLQDERTIDLIHDLVKGV